MSLALLAVIGTLVPLPAGAVPSVPRRPRALNLFSAAGYLLEVNRVQCGLDNFGQVCVAFSGSPVAGGGFWPKGTANGYIFNSGLQLAAVIDDDGGPWAGDTVGAFFFDPRGDQQSGNPITEIFSSLNPQDLANWPNGGVVRDTAIYNEVLIGRNQISEGDAWVRYWEGNPTQLGGRLHPMGVLVDQRAVAWNYPSGNEDIVYFIFRFYNVTASDPALYVNPDIEPELQAEVAEIGARFHELNNQRFGITLPTGGYTLSDMYAAFAMDNDVAQFGENYSTAVLPFNIGVTYSGNFEPEVGWTFPPTIFGQPFFAGAGFIGAKYLKSPVNPATNQEVGLTMFSNTSNGPPFPDAQGVNLLYRRLSGFLGPGDVPCNPFSNPAVARQRRLCYLAQEAVDSRFYQASGPFALAPGRAATIVVAYVHAAPVDIGVNLVGGDLAPGVPATGDLIAADPSQLRAIDSVMGWLTQDDTSGNAVIEQNEVQTVSRSLLNKALVAQAVFDNKFLLPFSPTAPQFFLVPGDDQVTVVWEKSPSEQTGDPFFAVASNPASPLYDPNFREFDVEGYRIYRGRTSSELELIAQFDYAGTTFRDFTGAIAYGDTDGDGKLECAPELGLMDDCPAPFATAPPFTAFAETPLVGEVVQVAPGGRVQLADTGVIILNADTLVTGGNSSFPPLSDAAPPFAFVDRNVRNSFTYHYAVTAFDVNSLRSGPTSLESPRVTKRITPRASATTAGTPAGTVTAEVVGRSGVPLTGTPQTIDPATGIFSGPAPPTSSFGLDEVEVFAPTLLQAGGQSLIRIDSVVPEWYHLATYFFTGLGPVVTAGKQGPDGPLGDEQGSATFTASVTLPADPAVGTTQGLGPVPFAAQATGVVRLNPVTWTSKDADWHPVVDGSFFEATGITDVGGSRWFDGANETMVNPALGTAHGQLTGVTTIFRPTAFVNSAALFRRFDQYSYHLFRAADIQVYWGATAGTIDSVIDVTHDVAVPYHPQTRASWGFLRDFSGADTLLRSAPDGILTAMDFLYGPCIVGAPTGVDQTDCEAVALQQTAELTNVDVTGDRVSDGTGFGLYINGEPFIFQVATLPSTTMWTYRSYHGEVAQTGGTYSFTPKPDNPAVPGLQLAVTASTPAVIPVDATADLSQVHTVPDPYYVTNPLEISANNKVLRFVNLPIRAIIRIYSVSGVLVTVLPHDDPTGGGEATWNLRNRNQQFVASGVYFYHVETPAGDSRVGRFTVVNFAP
jgi:hypothetical protein